MRKVITRAFVSLDGTHALAWPNPPYYVSSEALTDGYDTYSIVASSTIGISRFGCYLGGRFERALIWSARRCG